MAGVVLAASCGGTTLIEGGEDDDGTSNGSTSSSSAATSGSGGGGAQPCSLKMPCPDDFYCATFPNTCDSVGSCAPKPQNCDDSCTGVCGCDGEEYCNPCSARSQGVDVSGDEKGCFVEDKDSYHAEALIGALDRFILRKADFVGDVCVVAVFASPMMSLPGFEVAMPAPWALENAYASQGAESCGMTPAVEVVQAAAAAGSVSWKAEATMITPCEIKAAFTLSFADLLPGLEGIEKMDTIVPVEGCY